MMRYVIAPARPQDRPGPIGCDDSELPLSATLLRPYLDLNPSTSVPVHALGVRRKLHELLDGTTRPLPVQVQPPAVLRRTFAEETGLDAYHIRRAADLPKELRSDDWGLLVELIDSFSSLEPQRRKRVTALLTALGLYDDLVDLPIASVADEESVLIRRALATLRVRPTAEAVRHDREIVARVAKPSPRLDPRESLTAALTLVVKNAQERKPDHEAVRYWRGVAETSFRQLHPNADWLDSFYASIFYRAVSYVPYLDGDADTTRAELDLAEHYARAVVPDDDEKQFMYAQNLYPLLETRVREALTNGQIDLALERAYALVAHDPLDPRAHLTLAEVWMAQRRFADAHRACVDAAALGAPFTAMSWFLAGHCLELCDRPIAARDAYLESLRVDPFGVSAVRRLVELGDHVVGSDLHRWSIAQQARLTASMRSRLDRRRAASGIGSPANDRSAPKRARRVPLFLSAAPRPNAADFTGIGQGLEETATPSSRLLRPYLDLAGEGGPIHARALVQSARWLVCPEFNEPEFQTNTPSFLRRVLVRETGLRVYDITLPEELPEELRSKTWQRLCDLLAEWADLSAIHLSQVTGVLNRLGLYRATLHYLTETFLAKIDDRHLVAHLARRRANALLKSGHSPDSLMPLLKPSEGTAMEGQTSVTSLLQLVVHTANFSDDEEQIEQYVERASRAIEDHAAAAGESDPIVTSAYYRGVSLLPYRQGDAVAVTKALDRAEEYARVALNAAHVQPLRAQENLFAVLETRIKEASWRNDRDAELARASELVELDPLDPRPHIYFGTALVKQGRFEEGLKSFLQAAHLGAPHTVRAWFLVGQAREALGDDVGALEGYLRGLRIEPRAVSCLLRVHALASTMARAHLKRWSAERLVHLRAEARHRSRLTATGSQTT